MPNCNPCTQANPCTCVAQAYFASAFPNGVPTVSTGTCPNPNNCLELGNLLVSASDTVGPCNETGIITFPSGCFNFTGCGTDPVEIRIYSNSNPEFITVNSITTTELNYTTQVASAGQATLIGIEASCGSLRAFGCILICIADPCVICPDGFACNPCQPNCIQASGGSFNAPGVHPTTVEQQGTCVLPVIYSIVDFDSDVISGVSIDGFGNINYTIVCDPTNLPTSTTVTYTADACGAVSTAQANIIIDLCAGTSCATCEFCNPCTGGCVPYPAKTVTLDSFSTELIDTVVVDTVTEVITYNVICSDLLPATATVNYTVVECGVTEVKSVEILIDCPTGCCECEVELAKEDQKRIDVNPDTGEVNIVNP